MISILITSRAAADLDDIRAYTARRWGVDQAIRYTDLLITAIEGIAQGRSRSRAIPPKFEVDGFSCRCERHLIYWRRTGDVITVVAILHERMDQEERLRGSSR